MKSSRWSERVQKVEQLSLSFHRNPLTTPYRPRLHRPRLQLLQPSSVWRIFPLQSLALSFTHSCSEEVHVFSLEKETSPQGQRMFLVTSYIQLWHYYRTFPQSLMHCYELIPEGAVCKLYFDLEFHRPSNRGADGEAMVAKLIQYFCDQLMEVFRVRCSVEDVLNLDSSSEEKFSRHLIFNLQDAAFRDNGHVGSFILRALQPLLNTRKRGGASQPEEENPPERVNEGVDRELKAEAPQTKRLKQEEAELQHEEAGLKQKEAELQFLRVKNKDGRDALFVDLGVYSRNRNFRLYRSTKAGKSSAFTVAPDNRFIPRVQRGVSSEQSLFLSSLVCNVSFTGQRILSCEKCSGAEESSRTHRDQGPDTRTGSLSGCQASPHQEVDQFVLTLLKKDGIEGGIRRWNYFLPEQLIVYDISKYRWCENVQRFHSSNNIMIVVDLKQEVWYQKCHDPECRNFRSSSFPLPQEICVSYIMNLDEDDQAFIMDEAGNIELSLGNVQQGAESDDCGDERDDQELLESLEKFEEEKEEEIPDQLILSCLQQLDSQ